MLIIFTDAILKLLLLMQGMVKLSLKLTVSLGDKNTNKEWGGEDNTEMVPLLLLLFDADFF